MIMERKPLVVVPGLVRRVMLLPIYKNMLTYVSGRKN